MPEQTDGSGGPAAVPGQPAPELLADIHAALSDPDPREQPFAMYHIAEAVDDAMLLAWDKAPGTPAERLAVALQAAVELLEGIRLARAEGEKAVAAGEAGND